MPQITAPKKLRQSRVECVVALSMEETLEAEAQAMVRLGEHVKVDGFRPGKIPAEVLKQKIPDATLVEEAVRGLLPRVVDQIIKEHGVKPVVPPKVDVTKRHPLTITITFVEHPEVKVKGVEKIKIPKEAPKFDEKDIDRMTDYLRAQYRTTKVVDRVAKDGDQITLDFVGHDEKGAEIGGTRAANYQLVLGSKSLIPGFEDNLVGTKPGDTKSFTLTFPADYHAEHLKSKPVTFTANVTKVEEVATPELTDAFVKEHQLGESVDDLKKRVRESMLKQEEDMERGRREQLLFDEIRKATTVDLAEEMVLHEQRGLFGEIERELGERQLSFDDWMKQTKRTPETLEKELKEEATKRLTLRFGVEAILEQKKVTISDDEMKEITNQMLAQVPDAERSRASAYYAPGSEGHEELRWRKRVDKMVKEMLA